MKSLNLLTDHTYMVLEVVFPEMNLESHTQSPMEDFSNPGLQWHEENLHLRWEIEYTDGAADIRCQALRRKHGHRRG